MLKKVEINGKEMPVPVPVLDLRGALAWVEDTFVEDGKLVTSFELGSRDFDLSKQRDLPDIKLTPDSVVRVTIDSPKDLAINTLQGIYEMSRCLLQSIKPLAVNCWKSSSDSTPMKLKEFENDLQIIVDLITHLVGIVDPTGVESAPVQGIRCLVVRSLKALLDQRASRDLKQYAVTLLNWIEPLLDDLVRESEDLQIQVYAAEHHQGASVQLVVED